jgi:hypothetical protein
MPKPTGLNRQASCPMKPWIKCLISWMKPLYEVEAEFGVTWDNSRCTNA